MIAITGNKQSPRVTISVAQEDIDRGARAIVGFDDTGRFLEGVELLDSRAASKIEDLLTKIYKMGLEDGRKK